MAFPKHNSLEKKVEKKACKDNAVTDFYEEINIQSMLCRMVRPSKILKYFLSLMWPYGISNSSHTCPRLNFA